MRVRRKAFPFIILIICLFVAGCSVMYFANDSYRSEEQFKEYVTAYFAESEPQNIAAISTVEEHIVYDKPLSVAMRYPNTGKPVVDEGIKNVVKTAEEEFYTEYADNGKKEKVIRFVNYEAYRTQSGAVNIVLKQEDHSFDDAAVKKGNKKVYTYVYDEKTGDPLEGINVFNGGYRAYFSQYLNSYFKEKHGDELVEGYQNVLSPNVNNFKSFVLTDAGVRFYFQPGTILDESKGIVSVEIGYKDMEGVVRDKIDLDALDPERPVVALTYDDGPYPATSNRILDCLEKYNQVATFFEVGKNVAAYPDVVVRKKALGMEIGNHTWSHPNLRTISDAEIATQINDTNAILLQVCGQTATVFRPPYGNTNQVIEQTAAVPVILWSVDTLDWKSRDADSVFKIVQDIHATDGLDGKVILMHSIYESTAEATELLVPWLLENGYQLVTVSELIKVSYGEDPVPGKLYGYDYFYK